jgi:hypothetical protein
MQHLLHVPNESGLLKTGESPIVPSCTARSLLVVVEEYCHFFTAYILRCLTYVNGDILIRVEHMLTGNEAGQRYRACPSENVAVAIKFSF